MKEPGVKEPGVKEPGGGEGGEDRRWLLKSASIFKAEPCISSTLSPFLQPTLFFFPPHCTCSMWDLSSLARD